MARRFGQWFIVAAFVMCCRPAAAWDNPGHMAVAAIAYDLLSPAEQSRLVAILSRHRDVGRITGGLNTQSPQGRDLVMAFATWPDLIKEDAADYRDNGYNETGPIARVTDDMVMHKGWHFIDVPLGRDGTALPPAPDANTVDAVTVVNVLRQQLASSEGDDQKAFDLGWLLHLVGDLHQPLHCMTGVDSVYPQGDTGGNDILLSGEKHGETELHAYWDDVLGKSAGRDKTTKRVRLDKDASNASSIVSQLSGMALPDSKDDLDPQDWANEGYVLASLDVYQFPSVSQETVKGKLVERVEVDGDYRARATSDAQQQIKVAGYRLAAILKPILDAPAPNP